MKNANSRSRPRSRNNIPGKRPPNRNQVFDSNGPGVRVRGNAQQLVEKYLIMARDAASQGDRVLAENCFQHADHYQRVLNALTGRINRPDDNAQTQPSTSGHDDDGMAVSSSDDMQRPGDGEDNGAVVIPVNTPGQDVDQPDTDLTTDNGNDETQVEVVAVGTDNGDTAVQATPELDESEASPPPEKPKKPRAPRAPRAERAPRTERAPRRRRTPAAEAEGENPAPTAPAAPDGQSDEEQTALV